MTRHGLHSLLAWCTFIWVASMLTGCALEKEIRKPLTRTETDFYTLTERDTTVHDRVQNVPGASSESTLVATTSRSQSRKSYTTTWDSTADRQYPNFLRAGGLEVAGLLGSSSLNGAATGIFGLYSLFTSDQVNDTGSFWHGHGPQSKESGITKGELVRFMPVEYRLRWFDDAPNWTLGWSLAEYLTPDEDRAHHALVSIGTNMYVRRRFFIRDQIPYMIFSPFLGASVYPSAYVNLGGELLLGSLAGLNARAYAGLASGFSWSDPMMGSTFPYFGLGVSVMDFTNRVEETEHEWKDYVNTGINFNIIEGSLIKSGSSDVTIFSDSTIAFGGGQLKFASVEIPLPFANYHFWAGTSLLNWLSFGFHEQSMSVLPLRVGYRQYVFTESLMLEPFLELNYYPSTVFNIGARLKLDSRGGAGIGLTAGYASGSPGAFSPTVFNSAAPPVGSSFGTAYLGVTLFLGDWNFTPEFVRESRTKEIPSTMGEGAR